MSSMLPYPISYFNTLTFLLLCTLYGKLRCVCVHVCVFSLHKKCVSADNTQRRTASTKVCQREETDRVE